MRFDAVLFSMLLVLLSTAGCGRRDKLGREAIAGNVSLDAAPLDNGTIRFCPTAKNGLASGGLITAGKYDIPQIKGLPPGKYVVQISSAASNNVTKVPPRVTMLPNGAAPPLRERIPAMYNSSSQLSIEIKSGGGNVFDFQLNSRGAK